MAPSFGRVFASGGLLSACVLGSLFLARAPDDAALARADVPANGTMHAAAIAKLQQDVGAIRDGLGHLANISRITSIGLSEIRAEMAAARKEFVAARISRQAMRASMRATVGLLSGKGPGDTPEPTKVSERGCNQLRDDDGMPLEECHPHCQLPELNWTASGPPGRRVDQFGTLLQWDTSQWGKVTHSPRVACMLNVGADNQRSRVDIANTWGRHCDGLFFVVSSAHAAEVQKFEDPRWTFFFVKMKRPDNSHTGSCWRHANIWEKSWRMWQRAGEELVDKYDWFIKADTDTFVSVPNLRRYVQYFNPKETAYLGHTMLARWYESNIVFNSGCGYVLSAGTVRRVTHVLRHMRTTQQAHKHPDHCVDRPGAGEDPTMSLCLRAAGVQATNSLDRQLRQRFLPFRFTDHREDIQWPDKSADELSEDYFWAYKHRQTGDLENCCADEMIVMHNYKGVEGRSYFRQLERVHSVLNDSKPAVIPPKPQCFFYDEEGIAAHPFDSHRNILEIQYSSQYQDGVQRQRVFNRSELQCAMAPDLSEFKPTRRMPNKTEWEERRKQKEAALKAIAGDWLCKPGQGEYLKTIDSTSDGDIGKCALQCLDRRVSDHGKAQKVNRCLAFDVSELKKAQGASACRLYGKNDPRLGEPGEHKRVYCTPKQNGSARTPTPKPKPSPRSPG